MSEPVPTSFKRAPRALRALGGADAEHGAVTPDATQAVLRRLGEHRIAGQGTRISPELFSGLVRLAELAAITATGYLIGAAYVVDTDFQGTWHYLTAPLVTAVVTLVIYQALGLYTISSLSTLPAQVIKLGAGWLASIGALISTMFFLKAGQEFSRVWLMAWTVLGFFGVLAVRYYVLGLARRAIASGRLARRAVIYGGGAACETLLRQLEADASSDLRICGVFDDRDDFRSPLSVAGFPKFGGRDELIGFCRRAQVDTVILALPMAAEDRINALKQHFRVLPADIMLAATVSQLQLSPKAYSYVGAVPMLDLSHRPISGWGTIGKTVFDKLVAAVALVLLSPVLLATAVAIKLDSRGPVLFRQKRFGFNNDLIEVLKFRSMYVEMADAAAAKLVTKDDPRVTRVGRFIRKSSLDELPQLFNVLGGTLSLVGPRPHAVQAKAADKLYPDVVDDYFVRHKVKPGITGWAQINGWRGETDTPEKIQKRVEHDIHYIENWSLALDVYILAKTPASLLKTESAY